MGCKGTFISNVFICYILRHFYSFIAVNVSIKTINIVTYVCYNSEALSTHTKLCVCVWAFSSTQTTFLEIFTILFPVLLCSNTDSHQFVKYSQHVMYWFVSMDALSLLSWCSAWITNSCISIGSLCNTWTLQHVVDQFRQQNGFLRFRNQCKTTFLL